MTISCDDACASDTRLAELCQKYEINCMFYWPVEWHSLAYDNGYAPLDYDKAIQISRRFEVGSHTITHRHLTALSMIDAVKEIVGSKFMLERMFNREIRKFAPPRGYTNPELTDVTKQFYQSQRLTRQPGLVHIHPNSGANGNVPWREKVTDDTEELFCHSWELDKFNLWDELENYMKGAM